MEIEAEKVQEQIENNKGGLMTTQASTINDLFLAGIDDYRIDNIYSTSGSATLTTYLEPFLLHSIVEFDVCNQTLTFTESTDDVEGYFDVTLTTKNKLILSTIMQKYWLQRDLNNVIGMKSFVSDRDFKRHSAAQNLNARRELYNMKTEEVSQMINDYGYDENDWTSWKNQDY